MLDLSISLNRENPLDILWCSDCLTPVMEAIEALCCLECGENKAENFIKFRYHNDTELDEYVSEKDYGEGD